MPGIENFAPERTETSSGLSVDPSVAPADFLELLQVLGDLARRWRRESSAFSW